MFITKIKINIVISTLLFLSYDCLAFDIPVKQASIRFELKKGGQLFFSYPLNEVKYQEIMLPVISKDTIFIIEFNLLNPFVVFDLNKTKTPFLLFPGCQYHCVINSDKKKIFFSSPDKIKSHEANLLSEIENNTGKFELSLNKSLTPLIYKYKNYSRSLDNAFLELYKKRCLELFQTYTKKKITTEGYFYLKAYLDYELFANRLIPFYYKNFEQHNLPTWYRDSINNGRNYFIDSLLTNIYTFKKSLIYYSKFKATELKTTDNFLNELTVIRNYQFPNAVKNLAFYLFFYMNISQIISSYPVYIDSIEILCNNDTYTAILNNRIAFESLAIKNIKSRDTYLMNSRDQLINLDSLIKGRAFYIDFWATWCLPCIQELPEYSKVEFCGDGFPKGLLFISIDNDFEAWKKATLKFPFMNYENSFLLIGGVESSFAIKNKLSDIPRHIIFNIQGAPVMLNADGPSKDGFLKQLKTNKVIDCKN